MKRILTIGVIFILISGMSSGQTPSELQRMKKGAISPEEIVTISRSMTFDKAISVLSEVSKKYEGKIIIDPEKRTTPINVDVTGIYWREALELILRANNLGIDEGGDYIRIVSAGAAIGSAADTAASIHSREVVISCVFYNVDVQKLNENGIDWEILRGNNVNFGAAVSSEKVMSNQFGGLAFSPVSSKIPVEIHSLLQYFEQNKYADIVARPEVTVRSGKSGRIQIGQDFGVYQRDFAGNLSTQFFSVGTIVEVTPVVLNQVGVDFINLLIDVQRSSLTAISPPVVDKTHAQSNIILLNGEETVIGGLYIDEQSTTHDGIPILKDLPWWVLGLRYLFGYENTSTHRQELVILLKAELVPSIQDRVNSELKEKSVQEKVKEYRDDFKKRRPDRP